MEKRSKGTEVRKGIKNLCVCARVCVMEVQRRGGGLLADFEESEWGNGEWRKEMLD